MILFSSQSGVSGDPRVAETVNKYQGRRQDFAKGGAVTRRDMPTPLRSGVWGPLEANDHLFLERLVQLPFSFDSSLFLLSLLLSPLSSLSLLFQVVGGGLQPPQPPPAYAPE